MNFFLKSRAAIDEATKYLQDNGLVNSGISAKDWEIYQVIPYMRDGNWIDLGSDGSVVIPNLLKKNIKGIKVGIDLAYKENYSENGVDYIKGDLMNVPMPDGFFNFITCLSVVEHQVDYNKLAKECSRLLQTGGELFLSFDYWNPKPDTSKTKLYSLDWNILNIVDVMELFQTLYLYGLHITNDIDWNVQDAVINDTYCSPVKDVSYTFGILHFIKK